MSSKISSIGEFKTKKQDYVDSWAFEAEPNSAFTRLFSKNTKFNRIEMPLIKNG